MLVKHFVNSAKFVVFASVFRALFHYEGIDYRPQKAKKSNSNVLVDTSKDNKKSTIVCIFCSKLRIIFCVKNSTRDRSSE